MADAPPAPPDLIFHSYKDADMPRILLTYQIGEPSPRLSFLRNAMWARWGQRNVQEVVGGKILLGARREPPHALQFEMVVLLIGERTRASLAQRRRRPRGAIELNQMVNLLREVHDDGVRFMAIVMDDALAPAVDALPDGMPALAAQDIFLLDEGQANLAQILDEIERRCPPPVTQILLHPPILDEPVPGPTPAPSARPSDAYRPPGVHAKPPAHEPNEAATAGAEPPQAPAAPPDVPSPPQTGETPMAGAEPPEPMAGAEPPEPTAGGEPPALTCAPPAESSPPPAAVRLGVSAPPRVAPGDEFTARFVAYVAALEDSVRDKLVSLSPRAASHLGVHECAWKPGTEVVVTLNARGLAVDPPEQRFAWSGAEDLLEFDVSVPADALPGTVVLKFDAAVEGIVVARLRVDLEIAARDARAPAAPVTTSIEPARTAFASYSSADRLRVLDRIAAVRIATGIDVFVDCLDLRPSEEWKPQLDAEIAQREMFLLFWSKAASESKWVDWEWHTALARHGEDALQVHPLDIGIKPPAELKHLHFGDKYMVARKAFDTLG